MSQEVEHKYNDKDLEDGTVDGSQASSKLRRSSHGGAMDSSVLRFKDVNFVVGKGDKEKYILQDVSGKVKWGRKFCWNVHPGMRLLDSF